MEPNKKFSPSSSSWHVDANFRLFKLNRSVRLFRKCASPEYRKRTLSCSSSPTVISPPPKPNAHATPDPKLLQPPRERLKSNHADTKRTGPPDDKNRPLRAADNRKSEGPVCVDNSTSAVLDLTVSSADNSPCSDKNLPSKKDSLDFDNRPGLDSETSRVESVNLSSEDISPVAIDVEESLPVESNPTLCSGVELLTRAADIHLRNLDSRADLSRKRRRSGSASGDDGAGRVAKGGVGPEEVPDNAGDVLAFDADVLDAVRGITMLSQVSRIIVCDDGSNDGVP